MSCPLPTYRVYSAGIEDFSRKSCRFLERRATLPETTRSALQGERVGTAFRFFLGELVARQTGKRKRALLARILAFGGLSPSVQATTSFQWMVEDSGVFP
jgi:hypothetical protein